MSLRSLGLDELHRLLAKTPLMVQMHPLSRVFLNEEVSVFEEPAALIAALDGMEPQPEVPTLAMGFSERFAHRLPGVLCDHDPLTPELNRVLLPKLGLIQSLVTLQSQASERICREALGDCVVLVLVDGLSYWDWKRYACQDMVSQTESCFVDGVGRTEQCMKRIVGSPTVAVRLGELGYARSFGFSYWDRSEEMTDQLFFGVTEGVRKVRGIGEVLEVLPSLPLEMSFVQIVRQGLDHDSHDSRDEPSIPIVVERIVDDVKRISEILTAQGLRPSIFLTADHGILWCKEFEPKLYEPQSGNPPPRYFDGLKSGDNIWRACEEKRDYSALAHPFVRRMPNSLEWGVHGGLSFEESFVPFVRLNVEVAS